MKYSLKLRPRRALNRSEARACMAANVALPGAGSLAAGRPVGYVQMAAAFIGLIVTFVTGVPMIRWGLENRERLSDPTGDPFSALVDLWRHAFWPVVGIALFALGMLWSIATGMQILNRAPKDGVPPRIEPE